VLVERVFVWDTVFKQPEYGRKTAEGHVQVEGALVFDEQHLFSVYAEGYVVLATRKKRFRKRVDGDCRVLVVLRPFSALYRQRNLSSSLNNERKRLSL
jgi:hypothetical protein